MLFKELIQTVLSDTAINYNLYVRVLVIVCQRRNPSEEYVHIAQLAEHLTFNQKVGISSIPVDTKGLSLPVKDLPYYLQKALKV